MIWQLDWRGTARVFYRAFLAAMMVPAPAFAATSISSSFFVKINIGSNCTVSATDLDFGTQGVLAANIDAISTLSVACPNALPYQVGLDKGLGTGASTANRYMTGPSSAHIQYRLYVDAARSSIWGDILGVDTAANTGIGLPQTLRVYGRVPAQTTPVAGAYADTVMVTVTY